jgi:hypothetical protein
LPKYALLFVASMDALCIVGRQNPGHRNVIGSRP